MKYFLGTLFFTLLLISCGDNKIQEGEIEYKISYPYNNIEGVMEMMLPKKMNVIFKGDQLMVVIKKGKIFNTHIVSNEATKSLEMRLDFGSDVYNTFLDSDDIKDLKNSLPKYTISNTNETDTLFGVNIQKYNVDTGIDSVGIIENWFSEDFSTDDASWFSSYDGIKGMPMKYLIDRYGIVMLVEATSIKKREVKDSEFKPQETYEEVSYKRYDSKLKELYDVMME